VILTLYAGIPFILLMALYTLMHGNDYKYYRSVYAMLPFKHFYRSDDYVYSHSSTQKHDGFAWSLKKNSFTISEGVYLHNEWFKWFDPIGLYWLWKFQRWFRNNVNLDYLKEYSFSSYSSKLKAEHEFPSSYAYDAYLRRYYASAALLALANKDGLNEALVRDVMEVANKLVAELRFKEK
jgi:hypothetical protein